MSGPVTSVDATPSVADAGHPTAPCIEVSDSREELVGRMRVRRALPRRGRRTVGAWCFADHMGPADVTENSGLDIGPHPHIGLQTVTWLVDGQALHRDSLGSEQVIAPGQLNLMTAGAGVSHAEEATGHYRGTLEGIQLWVAQPNATRSGAPAFEHHTDLPQGDLDGGVATVLVGDFGGLVSPARHDTELVGVELALHRPTTVAAASRTSSTPWWCSRARWPCTAHRWCPAGSATSARGATSWCSTSGSRPVRSCWAGSRSRSRSLMWWNFVGRTREEIDAAYASWEAGDDRFGTVASTLPRIPARAPYWQELRSRG